jgi:hypothetical protein
MNFKTYLTEATIKADLPKREINIYPERMTFDEFYNLVNPTKKVHPDNSYDYDINAFKKFTYLEGGKRLFTKKIKGIDFSFYGLVEVLDEKLKYYSYTFYVKDDQNNTIGSVQDEWGAVLIMVAKEYRNFGIGQILGDLIYTYKPNYDTGGVTNYGYNLLKNVYINKVKKALQNGEYTRLVKSNILTIDKVKEILKFVSDNKKDKNYENYEDNEYDWLLYSNIEGAYFLYNKKLFSIFNDPFIEDNIKNRYLIGMIYGSSSFDKINRIYQFGGKNKTVKQMLFNFFMASIEKYDESLMIDDNIKDYKDILSDKDDKKIEYINKGDKVIIKPIGYYISVYDDLEWWIDHEKTERKRFFKNNSIDNQDFIDWLMETSTNKFN